MADISETLVPSQRKLPIWSCSVVIQNFLEIFVGSQLGFQLMLRLNAREDVTLKRFEEEICLLQYDEKEEKKNRRGRERERVREVPFRVFEWNYLAHPSPKGG